MTFMLIAAESRAGKAYGASLTESNPQAAPTGRLLALPAREKVRKQHDSQEPAGSDTNKVTGGRGQQQYL